MCNSIANPVLRGFSCATGLFTLRYGPFTLYYWDAYLLIITMQNIFLKRTQKFGVSQNVHGAILFLYI